jgi:hypothetical protein
MIASPKKVQSIENKSAEQQLLENIISNLMGSVAQQKMSCIDDLKNVIAVFQINQFNFNATLKNVPLLVLLMQEAEISQDLQIVLNELFKRLPIQAINWNFVYKEGNTQHPSSILLALLRCAMGKQKWAKLAIREVLKNYALEELQLDILENQGIYKGSTILGILFSNANESKRWAYLAVESLLRRNKIETADSSIKDIAIIGGIANYLLIDARWSIDFLKSIIQTSYVHTYDWKALINNDLEMLRVALTLIVKLSLIGHGHFLQKVIYDRTEIEFNYKVDGQWVIDILSNGARTKGLACQIIIKAYIQNKQILTNNRQFIDEIQARMNATMEKFLKKYEPNRIEVEIHNLSIELKKAFEPLLSDMLIAYKDDLIEALAQKILEEAISKACVPEVSKSTEALLYAFDDFNLKEAEANPLLPPKEDKKSTTFSL